MAYCAVLNSASSPVAWGDRKYAPDAEVTVCPCSHPHPSGCSPHSVAGPGWHGQEAAAAGAPHWQSAHNVIGRWKLHLSGPSWALTVTRVCPTDMTPLLVTGTDWTPLRLQITLRASSSANLPLLRT